MLRRAQHSSRYNGNGGSPHSSEVPEPQKARRTPSPMNGGRRYAHIVGWGMVAPEKVLTNDDLATIVETNDLWIRERTGIAERRIAGENETTAQMALQAAQRALQKANMLPSNIDLVIVATSTSEHIFPSTASLIQDWIGAKYAGAYDLGAACSGFVYALDMASAKIRAGDIDNALVIGAEMMSRVLDWTDRGTCILFGDGAGAVVLSVSTEPGGILSSVLRSDGSGADLLGLPTIGSRDISPKAGKRDDEAEHRLNRLHMNGREVFRFATRVFNESIRDALRIADLSLEEVDLIIPHQANQRIFETAARHLKFPIEKVYSNVARYGNTSAASIPIALCEAIEEGKVKPGDNIVFMGFGGGLSWASMVIKWQTEPVKPQAFTGLRRQVTYWYANSRRNVVRAWRRVYNNVAGSPTQSTMKRLRGNLQGVDWESEGEAETEKEKEK